MIEVLSVSADRINESHIESLIASKVPEAEQIEFKESLPAKSGEKDPWMSGGNRIGDRAKNAILGVLFPVSGTHLKASGIHSAVPNVLIFLSPSEIFQETLGTIEQLARSVFRKSASSPC